MGILSEWANAKSKNPQKASGMMRWFFASTILFFVHYVMDNNHFSNAQPILRNRRKSSKEKRELSMTTDQTYCIKC
jgi:hypothetical protein